MLRRILVGLGLLLALVGRTQAAPLEGFVTGQEADYQNIKSYQARLALDLKPLPPEGSSRAEMVLALAELASQAGEKAPADFKPNDYNALYALLQKYRDELRALGLKQSDIEDQLATLKAKEVDLEKQLKNLSLFALDGMKIYGKFISLYDEVITTGAGSPYVAPDQTTQAGALGTPQPSSGDPFRYRFGRLDTDLVFAGTRGPLSGLAELDYAYFFGIGFPGVNYFGVRQIQFELRLPVVIQGGDFYGQMTPLTLWRNEDPEPYEPEPFRSRRQRLRDDLLLKGNAVNLRGLRFVTDIAYQDRTVAELEGMFAPLGYQGSILYYRGEPWAPGPFPKLPNAVYNGPYNTYFGAWQVKVPGQDIFEAAYSGTVIADAIGSNVAGYSGSGYVPPEVALLNSQVRGYDSQVHSFHGSLNLFDGLAGVSLEMAKSLYSNPNVPTLYFNQFVGSYGFLTGTALLVSLDSKSSWYNLGLKFRNVDPEYISAPSQGRTQDTNFSQYGPFLQENSQFNVETGFYGNHLFSFRDPGEAMFTRVFLPPQFATGSSGPLAFNYLLPYNAAVNAVTPYGMSTPNRSGLRLEGGLNLWDGGFKPSATADFAQQVVGDPAGSTRAAEKYSLLGLGGTVDLAAFHFWPLRFTGGLRLQSINNGDWINFSSTLVDAGAEYNLNADTEFYAGLRHMNYQGTLAYPLYGGYGDPLSGGLVNSRQQDLLTQAYTYNQAYDDWAIGFRYHFEEHCTLEVDYGTQLFWDTLAEKAGNANHYEVEQGNARLSIEF